MNDEMREAVAVPLELWIKERLQNCRRIAATKSGDARAGWLEDAAYFEHTLAALAKRAVDPEVAELRAVRGSLEREIEELRAEAAEMCGDLTACHAELAALRPVVEARAVTTDASIVREG